MGASGSDAWPQAPFRGQKLSILAQLPPEARENQASAPRSLSSSRRLRHGQRPVYNDFQGRLAGTHLGPKDVAVDKLAKA